MTEQMDLVSEKAASDILANHWRDGTKLDGLPAPLRPSTRQDGYRIQGLLERRFRGPLYGWKIAATSTAGQQHIGVDGPLAGRLFAENVHASGDVVPLGGNRMRVAEAEFAFSMGRDIVPRASAYGIDEVMEAVEDLCIAIEIPDSRYKDFVTAGGPQLIADNACAHRFVIGPKAPDVWRERDLASHVVVGQAGRRPPRPGIGANVLGDPRVALTWLANELCNLGLTLGKGQTVTTGTCLVPLEFDPGDSITADFGIFGQVGCRIGQA